MHSSMQLVLKSLTVDETTKSPFVAWTVKDMTPRPLASIWRKESSLLMTAPLSMKMAPYMKESILGDCYKFYSKFLKLLFRMKLGVGKRIVVYGMDGYFSFPNSIPQFN